MTTSGNGNLSAHLNFLNWISAMLQKSESFLDVKGKYVSYRLLPSPWHQIVPTPQPHPRAVTCQPCRQSSLQRTLVPPPSELQSAACDRCDWREVFAWPPGRSASLQRWCQERLCLLWPRLCRIRCFQQPVSTKHVLLRKFDASEWCKNCLQCFEYMYLSFCRGVLVIPYWNFSLESKARIYCQPQRDCEVLSVDLDSTLGDGSWTTTLPTWRACDNCRNAEVVELMEWLTLREGCTSPAKLAL